jgi:hypothetical protein
MNETAVASLQPWDRPVFVITTGRSGSTLLLRYLNCAKDLVVWGEHAAILTELAACYAKLTRPSTLAFVTAAQPWVESLLRKNAVVCSSDAMTIEWVNSFDAATVRNAFRTFLFSLLNQRIPSHLRWGFKEIHYGQSEMTLLRQLFPGACFLLLVREPASIIKSKFRWFAMRDTARMRGHFDETLRFFQFAQDEIEQRNPDTMLVHYEDLAAAPATEMARIAAFLGVEMLQEQLRAIIGERSVTPSARSVPPASLSDALDRMQVAVDPAAVTKLAGLHQALVALRAEAIDAGEQAQPAPLQASAGPISAAA